MRALSLAAVSVHVCTVIALALAIALDAPLRVIGALVVVVVISIGWTVWLYRQDEEAALRRPPVPPVAPGPVAARIGAR